MVGVDSLLRMVSEHDADELRLGTDGAPAIFKRGAPIRLSIPPTSAEILRILLGPILAPEHEATLGAGGKIETSHVSAGGVAFAVTLQRRGTGEPMAFDALFRRQAGTAAVAGSGTAAVSADGGRPAATADGGRPAATADGGRPAATAGGRRQTDTAAAAPSVPPRLLALLQQAVRARASDLHLYSGEPPTLRVDGGLRRLDDERAVSIEELGAGWVDDAALAALADGRSVDQTLDVSDLGRFRINLYRAAGRLAIAARVLPRSAPELADLHMPVALDDLVSAPHGLVLVCGPTGSGKSATLAALAQAALADSARRGRARLLISLEDPVEYVIHAPHGGMVRQRQIGSDVRDFPTGLRDALREDPDLLLIGEMRDPETIGLAMTAAETGHLVLTSLHSRSAAASVERIVDSYPAGRQQQVRVQLADSLRAIVSQRLVPMARGVGRIPAVEILRGTAGVQSLIREGKTAQLMSAIQSGRKEGMLPLERCLADLVRGGQIDREQAGIAANDLVALAGYLKS